MKNKLILRVITIADTLDHSQVTGYLKVKKLKPELYEVEYLESEGRDEAIKKALAVIKKSEKVNIYQHDVISNNQIQT